MGTRGLAEYFAVKYAGYEEFSSLPDDESLQQPMTAVQSRIRKDKIILAYDRLFTQWYQLPVYKELQQELGDEFYWKVFQDLITNLAATINGFNNKEVLTFNMKLEDSLNQLRNGIHLSKNIENSKKSRMEAGIKMMQDYLWKETKKITNDSIDKTDLDPTVKAILPDRKYGPNRDYGPGKNPTHSLTKAPKPESSGRLLKRLDEERIKDDVKNSLGPYATEKEVNDKFDRVMKEKSNRSEILDRNNIKRKLKGQMPFATKEELDEAVEKALALKRR